MQTMNLNRTCWMCSRAFGPTFDSLTELNMWSSSVFTKTGVRTGAIYHFSSSSFYQLSQCSDSTLNVLSLCAIILPHVTLSTFILIFSFKYFSIVPDFYMHSWLHFHMLSLFFPCALTLFTTFSKLLWHFIFLWLILVMLLTYPNTVYKPMYLPSSSSVCKLMLIHLLSYLLSNYSLYSKVSLFSLVTLLVLW